MKPFAAVIGWKRRPVVVIAFTADGSAICVDGDGYVFVADADVEAVAVGADWPLSDAFLLEWDKAHRKPAE